MDLREVPEFHYITPVENLPSIAKFGVLSHNRAARLPHTSVALREVQDRRAGKRVPGALLLHDYVNLYFDARNPMMYYLKCNSRDNLVVLRLAKAILYLPGAAISDGNAACTTTRFFPSPAGLTELRKDLVYATWWTDPDPFQKAERKRIRCAEALIPHEISVQYILGVMTEKRQHLDVCNAVGLAGEVNRNVFFS